RVLDEGAETLLVLAQRLRRAVAVRDILEMDGQPARRRIRLDLEVSTWPDERFRGEPDGDAVGDRAVELRVRPRAHQPGERLPEMRADQLLARPIDEGRAPGVDVHDAPLAVEGEVAVGDPLEDLVSFRAGGSCFFASPKQAAPVPPGKRDSRRQGGSDR